MSKKAVDQFTLRHVPMASIASEEDLGFTDKAPALASLVDSAGLVIPKC